MPAVVGYLWGTDVFQNWLRALARGVLSCGIAPQLRHWIWKPAEWMVVVARQLVAEPLKLYPVFRRRGGVYNPLSCVPFRREICRNICLSSSGNGDLRPAVWPGRVRHRRSARARHRGKTPRSGRQAKSASEACRLYPSGWP